MRTFLFLSLVSVACSNNVPSESKPDSSDSSSDDPAATSGGESDTDSEADADADADADTDADADADTDADADAGAELVDADGDGWMAGEDCDDNDDRIHPSAPEFCDGIDSNCDGVIDPPTSMDAQEWYLDEDGDGYGISSTAVEACEAPTAEYVSEAGDCNDAESEINPGAEERCSTVDRDCDGDTGSGLVTWYGDDDVISDLTEDMRADDPRVTLSRSGTLRICEGEWNARIIVEADDVTIKGVGEAESVVLDGGSSGSTIFAKHRTDYLTVRNLIVTGGDAELGGGIRATSADVLIEDVFIRDNTAEIAGGGLYLSHGSLEMHSSEVSGNMLSGTVLSTFGGGIRVDLGDVEVYDSDIFANGGSGAVYGGGISIALGDLVLDSSSVDDNEANRSGGGVNVGEGRASMVDSRVRDNAAGEYGGGVKVSGSLHMDNSVIRDNTARTNGGGAYVTMSADGSAPSLVCTADEAVSSGFRGNSTDDGMGGGVYSAASHFELESYGCDWGAGDSNNYPHDVRTRDWIGGASADATFECNNRHGCDVGDDMWTREP